MTYSTLMAHMDVGTANDAVLRMTSNLARRFRADVIGIAACQPMQMLYSDGYVAGDMIQANIAEIAKETSEAEASFRTALQDQVGTLQWRAINATMRLSDFIVQEARAADLIITGPDQGWSALNSSRRVVVSEVVLQAGRAVLIVPPKTEELAMDRIVVAWKDTREARRAIVDALPILQQASHVLVVEIAVRDNVDAARDRIKDVAKWLDRHGVATECCVAGSIGDDAPQLQRIVLDDGANLMVAGAFGHNRLREWVLGGVTRDLLVRPRHCSLLSH